MNGASNNIHYTELANILAEYDELNELSPDLQDQALRPLIGASLNRSQRVDSSINRNEYFAIKDSDLKLYRTALQSVAGVAANPASAPVIAVKLIGWLFKYRKKRIRLSARQGLVMLRLKEMGAKSKESGQAMEDVMSGGLLSDAGCEDRDAVAQALESLMCVESEADGEIKMVCHEDRKYWVNGDY